MGYAPDKCPMCGNSASWVKVDKSKKVSAQEKRQQAEFFWVRLDFLAVHSGNPLLHTAAENAVSSMITKTENKEDGVN